MAQLEEEITLNKIKSKVAQSRLEFASSERNADYLPSGKQYLEVLKAADLELAAWQEDINTKIEHLEIPGTGEPPIGVPNRDDPHFRLLANTVPYIIEVRGEKDDLERWIEAQESATN